jgi:putative Holliday junction resolvase
MRYLGIDYGTKRIGVALSDEGGRIAFPLTTIPAGQGALAAVDALVEAHGVGLIVIGESRDLSGAPNPVQKQIREFGRELGELSKVEVVFEPELFTSVQAARQFAPEQKSRKANPSHDKLDAAAAALILQSFLDKINRNGN